MYVSVYMSCVFMTGDAAPRTCICILWSKHLLVAFHHGTDGMDLG